MPPAAPALAKAPDTPRVPALRGEAQFVAGPLRIVPDFGTRTFDYWAGIGVQIGVLDHGWIADSSRFVHCRRADWVAYIKRACWLLDARTGKTDRVLMSRDRFDGGHSGPDLSLAPILGPLGFKAAPGRFAYADVAKLVWEVPVEGVNGARVVEFYLEHPKTKTRTAIATFRGPGQTGVYPNKAMLSPDGRSLALVVTVYERQGLVTTAVKLVDVDARVADLLVAAADSTGDAGLLESALRIDASRARVWHALARALASEAPGRARDALERAVALEPAIGGALAEDAAFARFREESWFRALADRR